MVARGGENSYVTRSMKQSNATTHTLSNGMTVILEENHSSPVVALNVLAKVGSADETEPEAGISHVIEHMVFKGTPSRPVGVISREVEAAGGEMNAYTSFDQTVYYINMASRYQDKGIEVLADMLQNPLFDPEELARESEVIVEEIRRGRDNPQHYLGEILFQESFASHPYGRPIIGYEKTVRSFTQKTLQEYFSRWYHPKNMAFVAVGNFKTDAMLKRLESLYIKRPQNFSGRALRAIEKKQNQTRMQTIQDNIQTAYFGWGFHIPEITHEEVPAIDILSHVLAGADSSRLEQVVKEKKRLVHSISSSAYTPKDPGIFLIMGTGKEKDLEKGFSAIWEEAEKLKQEPIRQGELANAQRNIIASEIYERETVGGLAGKMTYFLATTGSIDFENHYYQKLKEVRVEEVQKVAQKYLTSEGCTSVTLVPKNFKKKILIKPTTQKKQTDKKKTGALHSWKLPNGIRLIVEENHRLPILSISSASMGGLLLENPRNNGINHLLSRVWTKGTEKRNNLEIIRATEKMAGQIEAYAGKQAIGLRFEFLSDHLEEGLDLFSEVLCQPSFDEEEVKKEKVLQIEAIKNQEDTLQTIAFLHFQKMLFPSHPYGMRSLGERATVQPLHGKALRAYYKQALRGNNLVISISGDCSANEIHEILEKRLTSIPKGEKQLSLPKPNMFPSKIREKKQKKADKQQAHIVLGFRACSMQSADRFPFTVLTNVLAGMGGRLFLELRDKLSLAYSVTALLHEGLQPGYFAIYIGTEPSKVPTAIEGIKKELQKLQKNLITEEELHQTQQSLVGSYELDLQKCLSRAGQYSLNELYGFDMDEIHRYPEKVLRVTREQVQAIAHKYIQLDRYVLSVVEP